MAQIKGLVSVVSQLRKQRRNLVSDLKHVDMALSALGKLSSGKVQAARRTLSASGRKRIAAAQRARWARVKAQNVVPITKSKKFAKRKPMSVSARRKIAAAQRARWAKLKRAA